MEYCLLMDKIHAEVMVALGLLETMLGFNGAMIGLMIVLYIAQDSFRMAANVTGDEHLQSS